MRHASRGWAWAKGSHAGWLVALAGWMALAGPARGGAVIENHAVTHVFGYWDGGSGFDTGFVEGAEESQTAGSGSDSRFSGSGHADVTRLDHNIRLHADARLDGIFDFSGNTVGRVESTATWRDVAFLSNTDPGLVGSTLRINVMASGRFEFAGNPTTGGAYSQLSLYGDNGYGTVIATAGAGLQAGDLFQESGWDTFVRSGDTYTGTFHLDIPIFAGRGYGGLDGAAFYEFTDTAGAAVQVNETGASVYASDPFQFLSITLPDVGNVTPESLGVGLTFDSGMLSPNLAAAVPEPSSIIMLGLGGIGAVGYGLRRRRKVV